MRSRSGFTLIEMVVVIAVIAILAGALVPVITRPYIIERKNETVREMGLIEEAIAGRPDLGDYGFVGSMGRVPANVGELLAQGTLPTVSATNGVPVGWNGPYLRAQTQDPTSDGWGTGYMIETNGASTGQWKLRSCGPDHSCYSSDDIVFPVDSNTVWWSSKGTLVVDAQMLISQVIQPMPPAYLTAMQLFYPNTSGQQTSATWTNNAGSPTNRASFPNVPFGAHPLIVSVGSGAPGCPAGCTFTLMVTNNKPVSYAQATVSMPYTPVTVVPVSAMNPGNPGTVFALGTSPTLLPGQLLTVRYTGSMRATGSNECWLALAYDNDADLSTDFTTAANAAAFQSVHLVQAANLVPTTTTRSKSWPAGGVHTVALVVKGGGSGSCFLDNGSISMIAAP